VPGCLLCKGEALSSNPSPTKKKKKKRWESKIYLKFGRIFASQHPNIIDKSNMAIDLNDTGVTLT
jgi:hypothetical protein